MELMFACRHFHDHAKYSIILYCRKNATDKIRTKLGRGFDSDSSDEEVLDMNQLDDYNPDLPDRFDDSSD